MSFADSWSRASCALLLLTLYFSCFLSISIYFSLSLSPSFSLSLSLSLSLYLCLSVGARQVSHDALYNKQHSAYAWVVTCILFLINLTIFTPYPAIAHIKFTNYSPTIFYDYHPQSCLKNVFFALGP